MKTPNITIYIDDNRDLVFIETKNGDPPVENAYSLDDLNVYGLDQASKKVGGTILAVLEDLYPARFATLDHIKFRRNFEIELEVISTLMSKSTQLKTKRYMGTIESLIDEVTQAQPHLSGNPAIAEWPIFKSLIETYPA